MKSTLFVIGLFLSLHLLSAPVVQDYEVTKLETQEPLHTIDKEKSILKIFPNPSSGNATIEYIIEKSGLIEITLHDNYGSPLYKLKNKSEHEAGTYQIKLTGINLPAGTYYCTIQVDSYIETKAIVIIK